MGFQIYVCPKRHVQIVADGEEPEEYCQYLINSTEEGELLCGAQPLTEVNDPHQILALAQGLKTGSGHYYGPESVHILADTALWKRMLQVDQEFALTYLRLLSQHDWSYD